MIYTRESFLSAQECEEALALFLPLQQGKIATANSQVRRRSRVAFLEDKSTLAVKVYNAIRDVNGRFYRYEVTGHEPMQLSEYAVGDEYDWHLDLGFNGAESRRKLSASVQLTDPEKYDGGDLQFWSSLAPRSRGSLVIFPSFLLHKVAPITRGVRHSLVVWTFGICAFR